MSGGDDQFASLSVAHSSTVDRVAEELRRAVFEGELEAGTPLREVALTASLGVSRSIQWGLTGLPFRISRSRSAPMPPACPVAHARRRQATQPEPLAHHRHGRCRHD